MRTVVRIGLVILSIAFTALVALFSLTPIAWNAAGRPNESYPELFFIGYGGPAAIALVLATVVQFVPVRSGHLAASLLVGAGSAGAILLCALVSATAILAVTRVHLGSAPLMETIAGLIFANFHLLWLVALVALVGGAIARSRFPSATAKSEV